MLVASQHRLGFTAASQWILLALFLDTGTGNPGFSLVLSCSKPHMIQLFSGWISK